MVKIPEWQRSRLASQVTRKAEPDDSLSKALGQAADVAGDIGKSQLKEEAATRKLEAARKEKTDEAMRKIAARRAQLDYNADLDSLNRETGLEPEEYNTRVRELQDKYVNGLEDPLTAEKFLGHVAEKTSSAQRTHSENHHKQRVGAVANEFSDALDSLRGDVRRDVEGHLADRVGDSEDTFDDLFNEVTDQPGAPKPERSLFNHVKAMEDLVDDAVQGGLLTPEAGAKAKDKNRKNIMEEALYTLIENSPDPLGTAQKFLGREEIKDLFSVEDRQAAFKRAELLVDQNKAMEDDRVFRAQQANFKRLYPRAIEASPSEVEDWFAAGEINQKQYNRIIAKRKALGKFNTKDEVERHMKERFSKLFMELIREDAVTEEGVEGFRGKIEAGDKDDLVSRLLDFQTDVLAYAGVLNSGDVRRYASIYEVFEGETTDRFIERLEDEYDNAHGKWARLLSVPMDLDLTPEEEVDFMFNLMGTRAAMRAELGRDLSPEESAKINKDFMINAVNRGRKDWAALAPGDKLTLPSGTYEVTGRNADGVPVVKLVK